MGLYCILLDLLEVKLHARSLDSYKKCLGNAYLGRLMVLLTSIIQLLEKTCIG